jgi:D-threonate/D-erythronate kinase
MATGQPIYVFADDLTGAADAANYFRTPSSRVRVSFNSNSPWKVSLGFDVVQVFDSESRALDVDIASRRVMGAGEQLMSLPNPSFLAYKKIDSTLRGHIGGEIEALLHGIKRRFALLAPSFPANGRTVQNGHLFVNGLPISQTAFARDPHNPVVHDKVADIVRQTTSMFIVELNRDVILRGSTAIRQFIEDIPEKEAIIVADATTDADLAHIAHAIENDSCILPCGSAGLAKHLAARWVSHEEKSSASRLDRQAPACDYVLIAVGSANPVSHQQLKHAASRFKSSIVEMAPLRLARRDTYASEMARAKAALKNPTGSHVLGISLASDRAERDSDLPGSFESDMADVIIHWTEAILTNQSNAIGFVATGGDTALALCEALSAIAIWPEGEVVSGIPWSWIETIHGKIPMISKAGGFGEVDALHKAAGFLLDKNMLG